MNETKNERYEIHYSVTVHKVMRIPAGSEEEAREIAEKIIRDKFGIAKDQKVDAISINRIEKVDYRLTDEANFRGDAR